MTDVEKLIAEAQDVLFSPYLLPEHGLAVAKLISATKALEAKETHTPQHVWDKIADLTAERDRYRAAIEEARNHEWSSFGDSNTYRILTAALDETKED